MQSCAEWTEQHGESICLYNHDGFNALTETEKEKWFAFILNRSCHQCCVCNRESSQTHAPNTRSALANKAFKIIVSCFNCLMDRTSPDCAHLFKNGLSAVITSRCYDAIFDSVALVSWMRLWLQLFIQIQICIQTDVLIYLINTTFQVSHM